jgi:hypothetical protein
MWPFRGPKKAAEPGFRGTPAIRRVKHYAADTGHSYQYSYRGWQVHGPDTAEHFFECRRDNGPAMTLRVRLLKPNLEACAAAIGRDLLHSERYAIVKLAFFAALDEIVESAADEPIVPTAAQMVEILQQLGRTGSNPVN